MAVLLIFFGYFGYAKTRFEYHNLKARNLMKANQPQGVLYEVDRGLTPLVSVSHYGEPLELYSAWAYRKLGQMDLALAAVNHGLEHNPWNLWLRMEQGAICWAMKDTNGTLRAYGEAHSLAPNDMQGLRSLCLAQFNSSRFKECIETLAQTDSYLDDQLLTRCLAKSWFELKEYEKSRAILLDGVERFPNDPALIELLAITDYSHLGNRTNAFVQFQRLLKLNPNHPNKEQYQRVIDYLGPRLGSAGLPEKPSSPK